MTLPRVTSADIIALGKAENPDGYKSKHLMKIIDSYGGRGPIRELRCSCGYSQSLTSEGVYEGKPDSFILEHQLAVILAALGIEFEIRY